MTTLVSPQGTLDLSKWTRTIAFLVALVVVSRVGKLVKGIKVRCNFDSEAHVWGQKESGMEH
jgi:K+-sensing histidine kinase KdpD